MIFPFTSLPPELRNRIYELVLPESQISPYIVIGGRRPKSQPYPISQVSRLLRKEALAVYFAESIFYIRVSRRSGYDIVQKWLEAQNESAIPNIKQVHFRHASRVDHGNEPHNTTIVVDMLKVPTVTAKPYRVCRDCEDSKIVESNVERMQLVIDGLKEEHGMRRLSKAVLRELVTLAEGLCIPKQEELDSLKSEIMEEVEKEVALDTQLGQLSLASAI